MHLQRNFRRVELPEQLADTTIVILGLMEMGYNDPEFIAKLLHVRDMPSLTKLLRMLKTSRNKVVRRCVDVGLPPGLCRPLPNSKEKVRCPLCRCMVNHIPCPRCSVVAARNQSSMLAESEESRNESE